MTLAPSGTVSDLDLTLLTHTQAPQGNSVSASSTVLPCQDAVAADLFFSERAHELEAAKAVCARCPLARECLEGALAREEPWGVWGGQIVVDGAVVEAKRSRGRPRKSA